MRKRGPARLDGEGLWEYALRLLAGRAHSAGELREKLRRRAERLADVEATLARLKESGYLDDRKFAESYAVSRLENQRMGKARVLADLRQRRVAPALAERSVRKVYEDVNEEELIEDFLRRKYRLAPREGLFQEDKDLAAAYRRLARAGFASGNIVRVLKKFARNPELLDAFEPPEEGPEEEA
ncbi:MAG TPA: regulatory protein RecX [Bryobacteraceae bacterium]|nr:regulatory protein RecX [Bryobacteraceae bacterium]